jgi:hypothetical protein
MQIELYDALKAGGTPEAEARHAAIEAAGSTSLLGTLAERINGLERLVLWMGGVKLTLHVLTLGSVLALAWQVLQRLPVR